ncbi:MAG: SDR family NAD(P)-dependent oxidoreductase [Candidatus Eisenbacteria bacterium]|uniref:SDR family NAD(P)-dependent oxidoreductase n=1 Tax=Eiseniibacteriota bacterium TaxID=2212470 RepID=A0A538SUF2_UNCEI|nr:MAG: SDR family NAD(P)-dependent oxidoreductase [Candidatus Eisenbacteria bacterium]
MELSGRSILLTGASGGIGRATAELLAREGARLTLFARRSGPLETLRSSIQSSGGTAIAVAGDVRSVPDAERAVALAVQSFGGLDAVVNNAGIGMLASLAEAADESVANVASFAGRVGVPYYSFYNASKFGLVGMTEAWRRELRPSGIDVVLLIPAAVETEFLARLDRSRALGLGPAGTVLTPERVAREIVGALRRPRPEVYIPRRNRWIGLLNVLSPRLADRIVNRLFRYPGRRT